jgi:iron complex transport system substrate-binding protein
MAGAPESRYVCLSAESADLCARFGVWESVVGVSAFADQRGLEPKPVIGGFSKADVSRIAALRPDVVFTFSDVQAGISAELISAGLTVIATNPRSLEDIAAAMRLIARVVGRPVEGDSLVDEFWRDLDQLRRESRVRPRIYFEEWPDPPISGIRWVSELIAWCGAIDVFAERCFDAAAERMVTHEEIVAADPEIILASWCGKPVNVEAIRQRPGFDGVSAVRHGRIFAIASADILQPGPRLIRGAREISRILSTVHLA